MKDADDDLGGGWRRWMIREYGRTVSEAQVEAKEQRMFGHLAAMSDDELHDAWRKAMRLRQREEFREAWPSLDILMELLNRFIAEKRGP